MRLFRWFSPYAPAIFLLRRNPKYYILQTVEILLHRKEDVIMNRLGSADYIYVYRNKIDGM